MTESRNQAVYLVPWELPPLAGLGPLSHLNFDFVTIDEIVGRHPEAPGGDLFDAGSCPVSVGIGLESTRVLTSFAGVRLSSDGVHRDG